MMKKGWKIATGGTDNHLLLWDCRNLNLGGKHVEKVFELVNISVNKNTCQGDVSALNPGGVRIGTPGITSRNMTENEVVKIVDFFEQAIKLAVAAHHEAYADQDLKEFQKMNKFTEILTKSSDILDLRKEINGFAKKFPLPGRKVD